MYKRLSIGIFIVAVVIAAGLAAFRIFYQETGVREKIELYEKRFAAETVNLALGAGPLADTLDPQEFRDNTYNLAHADQTLYYSSAYFKRVIEKSPKLKNLIIEVAPLNLFMSRDASFHDKARDKNEAVPLQLQGEVDAYLNKSLHFKNAEANESSLREMIRAARARDIEVYLVWPPYYSAFAGALKKSMDAAWKSRFDKLINDLVSEKGVHYIDLSQLFISRTDENDLFFDSVHLNTRGAKLFSSVLNTALTEAP